MKRLIFAFLLAGTATVAAQSNPPRDLYCRDMQIDRGTTPYCMSQTMQQCLASRASPNERCYRNPIYGNDSR